MERLWRIDMLGALRATSEDATITRFRTKKVALLLAFLAYFQDRSFSRDELADMLWPDFGLEQAKINLRQTLASLRRHIEPPSVPKGAILVTEQDRLSINASLIESDVANFNWLLEGVGTGPADKIESLKEAIALYKGDFLPGFYEEWVLTERHRLEDLYIAALQQMIDECERDGRIAEAVPQIHAALAKDRLREDLHFALIRAYVASGSHARAQRHFEEWRAICADELGAEPGQELQEFLDHGEPALPKGRREPSPQVSRAAKSEPGARQKTAKLPIQLTRFFGRMDESTKAVEMLSRDRDRLVTLFGPAGAGKTRLSIEIGRRLTDDHGWNVWFVPLADISSGAMLLDSVLSVMKIERSGQVTAAEAIRSSVKGSDNLIILDNLEHIVDSAVPEIAALLEGAVGISLLTTSRQTLRLDGEHMIDLSALSEPEPDWAEINPSKVCPRQRLQTLSTAPAIQLFVDRAQSVQPDFQLTARNAYAVAAICAKLDGLPLAIEIAAGLSNTFNPSQLLGSLGDRLEILRSRRRDVSPRHRSLLAAISYSYDLLSPDLQKFFAELSVFRGGFTLDAAEKVCFARPSEEEFPRRKTSRSCLRAILDLQERSLVKTEETEEGSDARFRLLESFREFGREQLTPDEEEDLQNRHADQYYSVVADYIVPRKRPRPDSDVQNWHVAMKTFLVRGDLHRCVGLLAGLRNFYIQEQDTIRDLISRPETQALPAMDRVWLYCLLSRCLRFDLNLEESRKAGLHALEIASDAELHDFMCLAHSELSTTVNFQGRHEEALYHAEKTAECGRKAGNLLGVEVGLINMGTMLWCMGELDRAIAQFEQALQISMEINRGLPHWNIPHNLSRVSLDAGRLDDAIKYAAESLRLAQGEHDDHGATLSLAMIARYQLAKGDLTAALATSHQALLGHQGGMHYWLMNGIQLHARILLAKGLNSEAVALLAASKVLAGMKIETDSKDYEEALESAKAKMSKKDFERAWAEGLAMGLDQAFSFACEFR